MPRRCPRLAGSAAQSELSRALAALRAELSVPDGFPDDVLAEADAAANSGHDPSVLDLRAIEFHTIDPPGSTDLDQALHLTRDRNAYRVDYAIADVPWFVAPGGFVDHEARRRGQTLYAPDGRAPLHPEVLSEGAASLLPGQDRQAFVWRFRLDHRFEIGSVDLARAVVRSRRKWSYAEAQRAVDDGTAPESLALLLPFGEGRTALEAVRGGASLDLPDAEVVLTERGYAIERRAPSPVELANAQLSLMTGIAAATIMMDVGIGILRTMPPAEQAAVDEFRHRARLLGLHWKSGVSYGDYLRGLDRSDPHALAVLQAATSLFRGAGYQAFDGTPPEQAIQAAIAAPYAHVTAPLRRLVDRFVLVVCASASSGRPVPDWVRKALPELPRIMAASDQLAARLDSGAMDRVEAALLADRVGEVFDAVVLSRDDNRARIQLADPPVSATLSGAGEPGQFIRVRLDAVEIDTGTTQFSPARVGDTPHRSGII
ncbi:RNB domain-containing ribonuclease [Microlunatus sp. Gsoil 973]|uniref:RNB domain-containing ribonuclease n=1 Tax=Microlunatus sp. Gsoil 973 TaxID=2672569 RepID=UPI0012B4DA58|nr:RNB domain-containing ribonuclease [Microlunatus sp. Gsoil 973]QGN32363.1 RNB domain-containing ribonuclease [Microlunatus sp. Gsoil 973]